MHLKVKKASQDFKSVAMFVPVYAKLVESVHGKNTLEYIDSKKELANAYLLVGNLNAGYKECLEAHELAKQLYGSEKNNDVVDILSFMAIIKMRLHQFDESRNFISKCKEIEEQLSSKFSQRYKQLIGFEKELNEAEVKLNKGKKAKGKKSGFFSKMMPNTPSKFAIFLTAIAVTAIGIAYYNKKK